MPAGSVSVKATFVAWSVGLGFRIAIVKVEASFSGTVVGTNVLVIVGAVLITERLSKKPESVPGHTVNSQIDPGNTRVDAGAEPNGPDPMSAPSTEADTCPEQAELIGSREIVQRLALFRQYVPFSVWISPRRLGRQWMLISLDNNWQLIPVIFEVT
jgi:hypothetical protein